MSKHQDALLRQWFMLRQVPRYPRKITVQELRRVLAGEGYEITARSLQRDLNELSMLTITQKSRTYPGASRSPKCAQSQV